MKILLDMPQDKVHLLDSIAKIQGKSRSELIRQSVEKFIEFESVVALEQCFGAWKTKKIDGVKLQRKLRKEWDT